MWCNVMMKPTNLIKTKHLSSLPLLLFLPFSLFYLNISSTTFFGSYGWKTGWVRSIYEKEWRKSWNLSDNSHASVSTHSFPTTFSDSRVRRTISLSPSDDSPMDENLNTIHVTISQWIFFWGNYNFLPFTVFLST